MLFFTAATRNRCSQTPGGTDIQEDRSQNRSGACMLKRPLVLFVINLCFYLNFPCSVWNLDMILSHCKGPQPIHNWPCHLRQRCPGQSYLWTDLHLAGQQDQWVHGEQGVEKRVWQMTNPRSEDEYLLTLYYNLFLFVCQDPSRKTVIGLLDIYGFEVFYVNRWAEIFVLSSSILKAAKT